MNDRSMSRISANVLLAPISLLIFLLITLGCDVLSRIEYQHLSITDAIDAAVKQPTANLIGLFLLSLPIVGAHLLTIEVSRAAGRAVGALVFVITIALLACIYCAGYASYQQSMAEKRWTDATLSLGLLPVKGGVVLIFPLVVAVIAAKKRKSQ